MKYSGETAKEASLRLGGGKNLVSQRINDSGWEIEKAFTTPVFNPSDISILESRIKSLEDDISKIKKFLII